MPMLWLQNQILPTMSIAREDELLGVREHSKNSEAKALTEKHRWWY